MTCTDHPLPAPTAARSDDSTLFAALELSRKPWLMATNAPGEEKVSKRTIAAGDGRALLDLLAGLREKAERRTGKPVRVVVIQEAGLDGFWVHRLLEANGIESHVVDPASIAVDRRHRRAKTDAIDGEKLVRTLMAWARGERRVCSMVRPPSPEEEDRRRLTRARHAAQGADPAHEPDPGAARRARGHRLRPAPQGSPGPPRRAQDRRRASLAGAAQGRDPAGDRAGRAGRLADGRGRA